MILCAWVPTSEKKSPELEAQILDKIYAIIDWTV